MEIRDELKAKDIKYTKQREDILAILKEETLPITISKLRETLNVDMDLSTIYRTLELFVEKEIVSKTVPLEPSQTVYEYKRHIHKHHLICTNCGKFQIVQGCPLHEYEHTIEETTGFMIERHQLELYGLCPNCQKTY